MPHSDVLETHANEKLEKILDMLEQSGESTPCFTELWLKAQKLHLNHRADLHLRTPRFDLHCHDEGNDMYVVIDNAIDKMVDIYKKAKTTAKDKEKKPKTEKTTFTDTEDKYTLSD